MAHIKQEWETIYKNYKKSGMTRGEYIKKHQLSTYAFEKFKKLDTLQMKKKSKEIDESIFVPLQMNAEKEEVVGVKKEVNSLVLTSGNIQIMVTEQTSQNMLFMALKAINELCYE